MSPVADPSCAGFLTACAGVELLPQFVSGEMTLDALTKQYIHARLEHEFVCVKSSQEAFALERDCGRGVTFGAKAILNPA